MRRAVALLSCCCVLGVGIADAAPGTSLRLRGLRLTSSELQDGGRLGPAQVYDGYGCHGDNRSPPLSFAGAPSGTRSLALTVFDPDAPTGHGWWHWLLVDLPATSTGLPADIDRSGLPRGAIETRTDFGRPGFGGACPPAGSPPHHYVFTLYALDVATLGVSAETPPEEVSAALQAHTLERAVLTVTYGR